MAQAKSIEVKVGLLILTAIGILTAFILIMGGLSFQPTYAIFADFDNPGGVQVGSPVRLAGVKVGKVSDVQFRGATAPGQPNGREPLVRLALRIERRYQTAIHDNAVFYVTTQGVLGEQFLAIEPGSPDRPVLAEGAAVRGLDPPRLDMLLAEGYELLHTTINALRANRADISDTFEGLRATLKGTGHFFEANRERLDRVAANVEQISVDTDELVRAARARYVDNPQVTRILANVDKTSTSLARDADGLLRDAGKTLANARRVSETVGSEEEAARLKRTLADVAETMSKAKAMAADAQTIVAHVKKGNGTVGSIVMDEQLYDDVQEMVRDLKHNPWKLFWKE